LIGAFIFALALAALPQVHERLHADANQTKHECIVTHVAAGNYHHAAPTIVVAPTSLVVSNVQRLKPIWVVSPFLSARILEHAPPQNS